LLETTRLHLVGVQQGVGVAANSDIPQESAFQAGHHSFSCGRNSEGVPTPPHFVLRSEAEQLVRQELITALGDFKHLVVAPLSPQAHQLSSFEKDYNVEHLMDTWSISSQQNTKLKGWKSSV
jgi:hypothetical protein